MSSALVSWSLWEQCCSLGNPRRLWNIPLEVSKGRPKNWQIAYSLFCYFWTLPSVEQGTVSNYHDVLSRKGPLGLAKISPRIEQNLGVNPPDVMSNFSCLWGSPANLQWTTWGQSERTRLLQRKEQSPLGFLSASYLVEQLRAEATWSCHGSAD